jgi:putative ABC transport system permease protein
MAPRWRKLGRDLWTERGRVLVMVVAIAVSVMGLGSVLGAYAILSRELPRNYLETRPASAAFDVASGVNRELVAEVRGRPGVADADLGEILRCRAKVGEDWIPLLVFVVDDFRAMRLNTFTRVSGAWPPPEGSLLIERSAVQMLGVGEGGRVLVKPPSSGAREVLVSGMVHDPGLAPAWQERQGYGYITRSTLAWLGESSELHELRVSMSDNPYDITAVETAASKLARWLGERGHVIDQVRVPPPGRHPHQSQMTGVLFLLLAFSVMALVLSGILVATSIAAMLSRQLREIGVMKTIGAQTPQIAALYAAFIAVLGAIAVLLAVPPGVAGALALASMSARMLNFTLASSTIPAWVFLVEVAAGILVPLLVAAVPIVRWSSVTVREAIDRHEAAPPSPGRHWFALTTGRWVSRPLVLALRNTFRRRTRLLLVLTLLAAGGAMFMTALNISQGWQRIVGRVYENRSYDVEIRLNAPAAIAERLRDVPGVRTVEEWGYHRTALFSHGGVDFVRTYPDGGHGSMAIMGPPAKTTLVKFPLLSGRWLNPGDTDAIVLNHMVLAQAKGIGVGDSITLSLEGRPTHWRVVGVVEEVGSPGVAYVTDRALARAGDGSGRVRMVRVGTTAQSPEARAEIIRTLERRLEVEDVSVEAVIPLAMLRTAMGEHVAVLIRMLLAMAALMVTVAALGLASTMGTNVVERTREIGVMRTLGATPRQIAGIVMGEALAIALMSWVAAMALSVPLTALVGKVVGTLAFRLRLPLVVDVPAAAAWLALVVVLGVVATLVPARRTSTLTVREALGRV